MRGGLSSQGAPQSRLGDRACGPRASAAGRSGRREAGGKTAGSRGSEAEHPASIMPLLSLYKNDQCRDFPGGSEVRTLTSSAGAASTGQS